MIEREFSPDEIKDSEKEPTLDNAIQSCKCFFEDEAGGDIELNGESFLDFREILSSMDFDDGLGYLFGWLAEQGVDAEEFLIEKGVLEESEEE
ncbi:hypothetical protein ACFL14_02640 [Patescibacteria group bacterium]